MDLIRGLERYGMELEVVDPWVDSELAYSEYGLTLIMRCLQIVATVLL